MNIADIRVTIELHSADGRCTARIAEENSSAGGKSCANAGDAIRWVTEHIARELLDDVRQRTGRMGTFVLECGAGDGINAVLARTLTSALDKEKED